MKRNFYFETLEYQLTLLRDAAVQMVAGLSGTSGLWMKLGGELRTCAEDSFEVSQKMSAALFKEFLPPIGREDLCALSFFCASLAGNLSQLHGSIGQPSSVFLGRLLPMGRLLAAACENIAGSPLPLSTAAIAVRLRAHRLVEDSRRMQFRLQEQFSGKEKETAAVFLRQCVCFSEDCLDFCSQLVLIAMKNA